MGESNNTGDFLRFKRALDEKRKVTKKGAEYWMGRDIQQILGYDTWQNFEQVKERGRRACESIGVDPAYHFSDATKVIEAGKGAELQRKDVYLSRYACYLIAMNGDPRKPEVGMAQTYFAVQTRRQEQFDQLTADEKRLELRRRVAAANTALNSAAQQAGVKEFALFHNQGYRGLYGMNLSSIKRRKGIPPKDDLLDRAGRAELAANEFRITQTEERLATDLVNDELTANRTHYEVGLEVRKTIERIGGTMPEDMKPERNIKLLEKEEKERKQLSSKDEES